MVLVHLRGAVIKSGHYVRDSLAKRPGHGVVGQQWGYSSWIGHAAQGIVMDEEPGGCRHGVYKRQARLGGYVRHTVPYAELDQQRVEVVTHPSRYDVAEPAVSVQTIANAPSVQDRLYYIIRSPVL